MQNALRPSLIAFGCIGLVVFGSAFVLSMLKADFVESLAKQIIRIQIERKAEEKIDALDDKFLATKAGALLKSKSEEITRLKEQLRSGLPARIAQVATEMADLSCECRKKIEKAVADGFRFDILSAAAAQTKLTALIRTKYMETAEKITREFRIFTGTNAVVFALLVAAAAIKRGATLQLLPPALVLLLASTITGYLYLFNQNWLHTVIFGDYVGLAYVGYMSIVFAILCDVIFNRARVTSEILNLFFNAVGSSLQAIPC